MSREKNRLDKRFLHTAQVTLEALTPISIKADDLDPTLDVRLVRDARGLPTIPGTSLAGVLRHLYQQQFESESAVEQLFGAAGTDEHEQASSLSVSFGYVHDAQNRPVRGPIQNTLDITADEVLALLEQVAPVLRDQVAINEYGSALEKAKIDRSALPRGTRFTFEIALVQETSDGQRFDEIISLLHHPLFRLGALTHRGFGRVRIVEIRRQTFNLADELPQWQQWRLTPWHERSAERYQAAPPASDLQYLRLTLQAQDFWRVGEGAAPLGNYEKDPDLCPWHEPVIVWEDDRATVRYKQVTVPASSIKGALRHRTVFHYLRLTGGYDKTALQAAQEAVEPLFGGQADHEAGTGGQGALVLDDIYLENPSTPTLVMHNAIDRFTGGVMRGALFSEEVLWQDQLTLEIWLKPVTLEDKLRDAFRHALKDLAEGRMNLGADFARGHGFFRAVEGHEHIGQLFEQEEARA